MEVVAAHGLELIEMQFKVGGGQPCKCMAYCHKNVGGKHVEPQQLPVMASKV